MNIAGTIVARNYLAQAQVLAQSFREHHPDTEFVTLVIDALESDRERTDVGRVLLTSDLGLDPSVLHSMSVIYDVTEYATALKPALLLTLLREGAEAAAYIDPDIRFYEPIDDVFASAAAEGIFLTPHNVDPMPRDGKEPSEAVIMHAGMYNLGFIAVGASAMPFLEWWHERLTTDSIVDFANALFTDQRWVDWVPSLFGAVISRDTGLDVAYWNLAERMITKREGRYFAGSYPLRFFHFSGFDPEKPSLLSKFVASQPRVVLEEHAELLELTEDYRVALEAAGHPQLRKNPYLLASLPNGVRMTPLLRRIYREIILGNALIEPGAPDPIDAPDDFVAWLLAPNTTRPGAAFSPAELGLWALRLDLRVAFPDPRGVGEQAFRRWLASDPAALELYASLGSPRAPSARAQLSERTRGVRRVLGKALRRTRP